jgi:hypothetical protein
LANPHPAGFYCTGLRVPHGLGYSTGSRKDACPQCVRLGPEWWRHVHRPHTEGVAIDAATAITHRWTSGARGQGVRSVWGNGWRGRPRLSGGPSAGGVFVATHRSRRRHRCHSWVDERCAQSKGRVSVGKRTAGSSLSFRGPECWRCVHCHTPKSSPLTLPPLPLIGGRAVRVVKGSDRWRADGMWQSSSFSGVGVGAQEMSGVSAWVSDPTGALHARVTSWRTQYECCMCPHWAQVLCGYGERVSASLGYGSSQGEDFSRQVGEVE